MLRLFKSSRQRRKVKAMINGGAKSENLLGKFQFCCCLLMLGWLGGAES